MFPANSYRVEWADVPQSAPTVYLCFPLSQLLCRVLLTSDSAPATLILKAEREESGFALGATGAFRTSASIFYVNVLLIDNQIQRDASLSLVL